MIVTSSCSVPTLACSRTTINSARTRLVAMLTSPVRPTMAVDVVSPQDLSWLQLSILRDTSAGQLRRFYSHARFESSNTRPPKTERLRLHKTLKTHFQKNQKRLCHFAVMIDGSGLSGLAVNCLEPPLLVHFCARTVLKFTVLAWTLGYLVMGAEDISFGGIIKTPMATLRGLHHPTVEHPKTDAVSQSGHSLLCFYFAFASCFLWSGNGGIRIQSSHGFLVRWTRGPLNTLASENSMFKTPGVCNNPSVTVRALPFRTCWVSQSFFEMCLRRC